MRRVLAPGGRVVLYGKDWDTFVTDSGDPELTRTIVCKRAEQVPSLRAARQYCNLLLDAGFRVVTVEVHTGVFTTSHSCAAVESAACPPSSCASSLRARTSPRL
jgi:hypothetical protein